MFVFRDAVGHVEVAFTDRAGGVSGGDFPSLNRVVHAFTGETRRVVVSMKQVHGADVTVVDDRLLAGAPTPSCDGLVTAKSGVVLLVRVADCVPVLLADPGAGLVAAVHAGRAGLVAEVVPEALARLRSLGGRRLLAWLGPHVCGACYEVPAAMREEVSAVAPAAHAVTRQGTPSLDIGAGVRAQLGAEHVTVRQVGGCTVEDPNLFSYRREGRAAGRLAGLVWVRP